MRFNRIRRRSEAMARQGAHKDHRELIRELRELHERKKRFTQAKRIRANLRN